MDNLKNLEQLGFAPKSAPRLDKRDTAVDLPEYQDKNGVEIELAALRQRIGEMQDRMFTRKELALLVILQGLDSAGKDSTTQAVFTGVNPLGIRAASFSFPTPTEQRHDFLWRVHAQVPPRGCIGVFNRSHYEDPVINRVHGSIDKNEFEARLAQIADFERMLAESGTTLVKCFLHLGKDEQRERLQERVDNPKKHWKFDPSDLSERKLWDDYHATYESALQLTNAKHAPWYVVPADRKPIRNLLVARLVLQALESMPIKDPKPKPELRALKVI
ncbi:MAG: polyphosphate kinase 2 family protein [Betaproteobacteria bacterium]|jgi:PPK2 family polyphosphate:nucleotide phosphotransferase|uniref:Putative Polyphosphate kinase n=1 Tax=Thiomonas delicata TaxID=364030 RepID=A0A238CZP7_THIDL|nr:MULTISPECIES: PPK2 family polyphosphate kinase [Thiomonas]MDE2130051.1 polyphosphate kinase 2 family protein [Betaproteobacteria bacterium]OZB64279.1 MAG: polyphosphate kinase [Thiomonas sp. 13-66-29]SBP86471.1 putative Polyphosphate kinase [Thiomonas delicata]